MSESYCSGVRSPSSLHPDLETPNVKITDSSNQLLMGSILPVARPIPRNTGTAVDRQAPFVTIFTTPAPLKATGGFPVGYAVLKPSVSGARESKEEGQIVTKVSAASPTSLASKFLPAVLPASVMIPAQQTAVAKPMVTEKPTALVVPVVQVPTATRSFLDAMKNGDSDYRYVPASSSAEQFPGKKANANKKSGKSSVRLLTETVSRLSVSVGDPHAHTLITTKQNPGPKPSPRQLFSLVPSLTATTTSVPATKRSPTKKTWKSSVSGTSTSGSVVIPKPSPAVTAVPRKPAGSALLPGSSTSRRDKGLPSDGTPENVWLTFFRRILDLLLSLGLKDLCDSDWFENYLLTDETYFARPRKVQHVYESVGHFVGVIEPAFILEAFQSIQNDMSNFRDCPTNQFAFWVSQRQQCSSTNMIRYHLDDDRRGRPVNLRDRHMAFGLIGAASPHSNRRSSNKSSSGPKNKEDDDVAWYKELIVMVFPNRDNGRLVSALGFVSSTVSRRNSLEIEVYVHPTTPSIAKDGTVFVSRLCPMTSDFRRNWALTCMGEHRQHCDAFLGLSLPHYKSEYPEPAAPPVHLEPLNATQRLEASMLMQSVLEDRDAVKVLPLQGPPGTGKSRLIVALVHQLWTENPDVRILVTAPTNTAVDDVGRRIAESLEGTDPDDARLMKTREVLLRIGHPSRIKEDMKEFSLTERLDNYAKHGVTAEDMLREGRIFLATLNVCGSRRMIEANKMGGFDVIIVDEASQALMLDTLIPISVLGILKMILVGDPQQLPATVSNRDVQDSGYATSWLERIATEFHRNNDAIPCLREQYRMHPDICRFPSAQFYNGKVVSHPSVTTRNKDWPLARFRFINLRSSVEDRSGTSYWNSTELGFTRALLEFCVTLGIKAGDVAVITGYAAQRSELKRIFECIPALHAVRVSTVDGFQGQEAKVIIISCVRTGKTVGFWKDLKRLNVALTRAQESLFVVGNAATMKKNKTWGKMLDHARRYDSLVEPENLAMGCQMILKSSEVSMPAPSILPLPKPKGAARKAKTPAKKLGPAKRGRPKKSRQFRASVV